MSGGAGAAGLGRRTGKNRNEALVWLASCQGALKGRPYKT
jgi:hypothetical protein